jgi:hypoxanthine phosphoribosyltransferase
MSAIPTPRVLITAEALAMRVHELAGEVAADYASGPLVVVGVLKGAYVFMADLTRALQVPHTVEFIAASSYGMGTSSGDVRLVTDLRTSVAGKHVLLVDDILDRGNTLGHLSELLRARQPASVRTAVLLAKPNPDRATLVPDYVGFQIPDVWAVGYGLDLAEQYRGLPFVGELSLDEAAQVLAASDLAAEQIADLLEDD